MNVDPFALAEELWHGPWSREPMRIRLAHLLGRLQPTSQESALVDELLDRWPRRPTLDELSRRLFAHPIVRTDWSPPARPGPHGPAVTTPRLHQPMTARPLTDRAALRELLWLTDAELDWFADRQGRNVRAGSAALTHYRYRVDTRGRKARLLEIPKSRLKELQRRLARHVAHPVPLHPAAHGAVLGKSVRSCLLPHAGQPTLVRCDLEGFFAAITDDRVGGLLRATGLPDEVAALAAALCTNAVPEPVRRGLPRPGEPARQAAHWRTLRRLATPHLPQGAPSSPGLANAIAFSLDHRLSRLAAALGARYTRYVDDLVFSGPARLPVGALLGGARDICRDEGFRLAEHKTAVVRSSRRQRALGAVVNDRPSIDRAEIDRLRAILHNCRTRGPASQANRAGLADPAELARFRSSLRGRIAWVTSIDPVRGGRLTASFALIDWT